MIINHDLHIHTRLSPCCTDVNQTPQNIIPICRRLGLHKIGFSDHAWLSRETTPSGWHQNSSAFSRHHKEQISATEGITVLLGCEADTLAPGRFSINRQFADSLDYVIMAANHFHFRDMVEQPSQITPAGIGAHMVKMFLAAVRSKMADIIPHVFLPMGYWDCYEPAIESIDDRIFREVFQEAAANNVAIEITPVYLPPLPGGPRQPWQIDTPLRVLTLAKQAGCRFTFGSDAHSNAMLNKITVLEDFVERLGLSEADIHPLGC